MKSIVNKLSSNSMVANSMYSLSAKAFSMIFFFLFEIFCARILNANAYGEWAYFYAIITIVYSIVWFGINVSSKIFIAKTEALKQMEVFSSALRLRFFVSIVLTLIYMCVVIVLTEIRYFDNQKYEHLSGLLFIGGFLVFLNSFTEFFKEVFIGLIDFKGVFIINFCEYAGYLVFGVLCILIAGNVIGIVYGFSLSLIITVFIGVVRIIKINPLIKTKFDKQVLNSISKDIFKYAKYIALSGIGTILLTEIDTFMLGYFREGYDTAVYSIAKQLSAKAVHVNIALSTSMMPIFANITAENIFEKKKKLKKIIKYNAIVTFSITFAFLLLGSYAIEVLYGKEYIYSAKVLFCLLPYYIMTSFSKFFVLFLDYQNKAKVRSMAFFITLIMNIILNTVLIPSYGAAGAALATNISLVPYFVFLIIEVKLVLNSYTKK